MPKYSDVPEEIKKRYPPPPIREKCADQEDFEERMGRWQETVGRNIGLIMQQMANKSAELAPEMSSEEIDESELFDLVLSDGKKVAYQEWDSGGAGAGAGEVGVYKYKNKYYVLHDAGMSGPFKTEATAFRGSDVSKITSATLRIWRQGKGFVYVKERDR